jgi:ATP-binding protein involved in chromosome partitioning
VDDRTTPQEIGRAGAHDLRILWRDGHVTVIPARALRLACPCALCVEEMTGRALLKPGTVAEDVHPVTVTLVGNYAAQPRFSDGHETGIYTFEYLRALCACPACRGGRAG